MTTMRNVVLANDCVYHVYNRGVGRVPIFTDRREFARGVETLKFYRYSNKNLRLSKFLELSNEEKARELTSISKIDNKLVELIAYSLMPNHFHLLIKQLQDNGISRFLSNFTNSYTKYFNTRHGRIGPLVQGIFKASLIETNEQFIHVSRYIHINPVVSLVVKEKDLESYEWSSLRSYLGLEEGFVDKESVISNFPSEYQYKQFIYDHIDYAKQLESIKHLIQE
ncbi:transposase [Candidatus Collierbacteria bacterium]|nr:transposase [Candidatus Collierbacteria bacterium]